jgi:hypothetical protein
VLHHGSIKLGTSALEGDIATLRSVAPAIDLFALAAALRAEFGRAFGVVFEAGVPDEDERKAARALGQRYVSREFVESR